MALSPWVENSQSGVAKIMRRTHITDFETINEVASMASALVEEYAPGAPQSCRDEAVLRLVSHLAQTHDGLSVVKREQVGPRDVEYITNYSSAFRNCGAAALLTRWKIRRGGVIG